MEAIMDCIEWNDNCSVRVQQIDEHHKHLFVLLKNAYLSCTNKDQLDGSERVIDELVDYATYHFATEERLMKQTGYYDEAAHVMEHQRFIQRVHEFQHDLVNDKKVYSIELIGFLGNWLLHHIMEIDKKLGLYLNTSGIH
jgi:hemerythrin